MYEAEGDKVYVTQVGMEKELFLTVHPTSTDGTTTLEEQAALLAEILNTLAELRK